MDEQLKKIEELRNTIRTADPEGVHVNTDDGTMYVSIETIPIKNPGNRNNIEDEFTLIRSALLYDVEQIVFRKDGSVDLNMRRCPYCGFEIVISDMDDFCFVGCSACNYPIWVNRHESLIKFNKRTCWYYTVHYSDSLIAAEDLRNRFVKCYDRKQIEKLLDFIDKDLHDVTIVFHPGEPSI